MVHLGEKSPGRERDSVGGEEPGLVGSLAKSLEWEWGSDSSARSLCQPHH